MYYNLDSFGKEIRALRESFGYSREKLSVISYLNVDTIRRIETNFGSVPSRDILESLSISLKSDLNILLFKYRVDDANLFNDIKIRLENKINVGNSDLNNEIEDLKKIYDPEVRSFIQVEVKQLILLAEGIIEYENNDYDTALEKFSSTILINTPKFTIDTYQLFVYSDLEIRILMNIAFTLNKKGNLELFIDILEFCIESIDTDNELFYKLCHNLSGAFIRKKDYESSLNYANKGIHYCETKRTSEGLHILYYGKAVAQRYLNDEEYEDSVKKAIALCEIFKYEGFKEFIYKSDMVKK